MDVVKELELSLKEIAKWEAFEARRIATLARRESRAKLAADANRERRNLKRHAEYSLRKAKQTTQSKEKWRKHAEVSNLKRRLSRLTIRLAAIPADFKCPKCGHKKLKNRMWVIVDGVAICKGCHLGWKEPKPIEEVEKPVDAKAALRTAVPKDYVCKGCHRLWIALKYWQIDSNGLAMCKKCVTKTVTIPIKDEVNE